MNVCVWYAKQYIGKAVSDVMYDDRWMSMFKWSSLQHKYSALLSRDEKNVNLLAQTMFWSGRISTEIGCIFLGAFVKIVINFWQFACNCAQFMPICK